MFLKHIDLTTALRPSYLSDEVLLFVQDNVGLYEGKLKLPNHQNGQVYLTSHRICYVDKTEPRTNSVALNLKEVDRYEFYAGFLKSSAKITLIPKPTRRSNLQPRTASAPQGRTNTPSSSSSLSSSPHATRPSPEPQTTASWICTICSFSNPVPSNFDPHSANPHMPMPPCLACGIKPTLVYLLKASIANASNRNTSQSSSSVAQPVESAVYTSSSATTSVASAKTTTPTTTVGADPSATFQCPRCTFSNHPSMLSCELCGAALLSQSHSNLQVPVRAESPGPAGFTSPGVETSDSIKLSFRGGGEKIFYERLKGAMTQRKWLLQGAPPVPNSGRFGDESSYSNDRGDRVKTAGIAGLEQLGLNMRKNNEMIIGNAFEDLETLMSSAKEVVALAERFARQTASGGNGTLSAEASSLLAESANQLGLVATKDIVGTGSNSESLYVSELSRNLAEFLTDDARGVLRKAGGIISLVDLWAVFNRARGGVELVSPTDFEKAAQLWEKLKLPVRLRKFKSGVLVVQGADRTDETTIKSILAWMRDLHEFPPEKDVAWDWQEFGRGITARDAAERFGWSIGVAEEELEMAEERGSLCREEGIEGLKYWENFIGESSLDASAAAASWHREQLMDDEERHVMKKLKEVGLL